MSPTIDASGRVSRWCPTAEQVMILEELYKGGLTNPNAGQIHQIVAYLSQFGKVQGKNIFYWFQNHKARDKQKTRKMLVRKQQQSVGLHMIQRSNSPYCKPEMALTSYRSSVSPFNSDERTSATALAYVSNQHTNESCSGVPRKQDGGWNSSALELAWARSQPPASCDTFRPPLTTLDLFPVTPMKESENSRKVSCNYSRHSHASQDLPNPNLTLGR